MKIDVLALLHDEYPFVLDTKSDFVKNGLKYLPNSESHLNNFILLYDKDNHYIETELLKKIKAFFTQSLDLPNLYYFQAVTKELSVNVNDGNKKIIVVDELIASGLSHFYMIILQWSIDINNSIIHKYSFKYLVFLLDMEFTKKGIGTINDEEDISWLQSLNKNAIEIASDCYWVSWSFMVFHEIAHLLLGHTKKQYSEQHEYEADKFAYKLIIELIKAYNESDDEIMSVFKCYTCFAPMMLFDFYRTINMYQKTVYPEKKAQFIPDPKSRIERLIEIMENEDDSFDNLVGMDVYNNYLDVLDYFWGVFENKFNSGQLDFIRYLKPE